MNPFYKKKFIEIYHGDVIEVLKQLPEQSVNCVVTSPPYWNLRNYETADWEGGDSECTHQYEKGGRNPETSGKQLTNKGTLFSQYEDVCKKCGAKRIDNQIGLERTPEEYVNKMVQVFREVRRVLRDDGTLWLNLGDSYASDTKSGGRNDTQKMYGKESQQLAQHTNIKIRHGLKPKDLVGIPWRVTFALQADGWYLRQDIIWCLSGGTWVYARTQKGDMPMMVRDLARLDPTTVQLWNGEKWTQLRGMSKSERKGTELELVLRSGERISCTPTHRFPTHRGLLDAGQMQVGDVLDATTLPELKEPLDTDYIGRDAAWLAGLYIAEGSRSHGTIQISGHIKEEKRWLRLRQIAKDYGGTATRTIDGNNMNVRLYGKVLNAIIDQFVTGRTAKDKGFNPIVWRYSNLFLAELVNGYLAGDGGWDAKNQRWRLGFTRNYNLERDLRTVCARLGYRLTLKLASVPYDGRQVPTFRGEIRMTASTHHNAKHMSEIVEIRKARCRYVYDLGVADEPHVFALASGILTHNSKPNPMPESIKDRCTKSHEYIFLLTKSPKYYYDYESILEPASYDNRKDTLSKGSSKYNDSGNYSFQTPNTFFYKEVERWPKILLNGQRARNKRSVWTVNSQPYKGAHFATFPEKLIEPCIKAGCPEQGTVLDPFLGSGTTAIVAMKQNKNCIGIELSEKYIIECAIPRIEEYKSKSGRAVAEDPFWTMWG